MLTLAVSMCFVPVAAAADEEAGAGETGFGYWESSSFAEVYESVTASNTPEIAAAILSEAANDPEMFPALDGTSEEEQSTILLAAASAAAEGEPLSAELETQSMLRYPSPYGEWGLGSPVWGYPIANGYAWEHKDRYYWRNCDAAGQNCSVDDWKDFTYRVDPGGSGTRLTVSTLTHGFRLPSHRVDSLVYRDAQQLWIKDGPQRQGDGTYEIRLYPHHTLTGYTFAAALLTTVSGPTVNGPGGVFRTGPTSECTEPSPGAWRCIFLD